MECEYCKSILNNKYSLAKHKKTAKFCLKIRDIDIVDTYICEYCSKLYIRQYCLTRHLKTCQAALLYQKIQENEQLKQENKRLLALLKEKDKIIKDLERHSYEEKIDIYKKLAERPTTTNNNTNTINFHAPLDLSDDRIKKIIEEKFCLEYLRSGQKGVARFSIDNILTEDDKLLYKCTDTARHIFRYKDTDGAIVKDVQARKLSSTLLKNGIVEKSTKVVDDFLKRRKVDEITEKLNSIRIDLDSDSEHEYEYETNEEDKFYPEVFLHYMTKVSDVVYLKDKNGSFRNELASIAL